MPVNSLNLRLRSSVMLLGLLKAREGKRDFVISEHLPFAVTK